MTERARTSDGAAASQPLALVMTGGGARSAYQVGCLAGLVRMFPEFRAPILTGVSAGAINAVTLAASEGTTAERVADLTRFWRELTLETVFRAGGSDLLKRAVYWGSRLLSGGHRVPMPEMRGMVDTAPLWDYLRTCYGAQGDRIPGIAENIVRGDLTALAITGSSYSTGKTTTWIQGRDLDTWQRDNRISEKVEIGVREVMASAALPLLFPAVEVRGRWYGDGGIRLTAPLAPAVHLGAGKILAVSTRYDAPYTLPDDRCFIDGYPPPAQVMGALLNAVFLDQLDADSLQLHRTNRLLAKLPPGAETHLRPIDLVVLRPSKDLGAMAGEYEIDLPRAFRFMTRGLGTGETRSNDLLSMLMFQNEYIEALIELGMKDAESRQAELATLLGVQTVPGRN